MRYRIAILIFVILVSASVVGWNFSEDRLDSESGSGSELSQIDREDDAKTNEHPALTNEEEQQERRQELTDLVSSLLGTAINFHGQVVDQDGNPVPGARVGFSALDKFMEPGTSYSAVSDNSGLFSITGIKGARLSVNVRKDGYYFIDGKSNAAFAYGGGSDSYFREPPTQARPAIFVLHKMGETVPLVHVRESARIAKDGTPVTIDLLTGRASSNGNFRIETWTEQPQNGRRFNWFSRLSVPGGGLIEREGQFEFEAPETGYQQTVELGAKFDDESWSSQAELEYFVKLADGRHGRIKFRMIAGGNHYFVLEAYMNPEPGNRNLEFDPEKVVRVP